MPHIVVEGFAPPKTPSIIDGYQLEFASGEKSGFVAVQKSGERFLIRWFAHKNGTIIKTDKATRVARLELIKNALKAVAKNAKTIYSTVSETKATKEFEALKTPHFFTHTFDYKRPLWVEVGFGSGRHILQNAKDNPTVLHVGIEVHKPSAEQLLRRTVHEKLSNIVVILSDARVVLETIATAGCERIFVHFPVPWDDAPSRRVFSDKFIAEAMRTLTQNGTLELRTDSKSYFDYASDLIKDLNSIDLITRINENTHTTSKYEERWKRLDKDIYDLVIKKSKSDSLKLVRYDFGLTTTELDLMAFVSRLQNIKLKGDFLLKVRDYWQIDDGVFLQIAMGSFDAPQTIYIKAHKNSIEYYPSEPLHTKQNFLAHTEIQKAVYGT